MTTVAPNKLYKKPLKLPLKASPPPPPAKPTVTVIIKVGR